MNIEQLRYFLIASKSKSYSAAAKEAFTSRQNIARSIHALEEELGVELFSKSSSGIELTLAGERARDQADSIISGVDELLTMFSHPDGESLMEVSFSHYVTSLFPYLETFDIDDSKVRVTERRAPHCADLVGTGEINLAFVGCMERTFPGCNAMRIDSSPMYALCAQDSELAKHESLSMHDLARHDFMLLPPSSFLYVPLLEACKRLGLPNKGIREISSIPLMRQEVMRSDGVAFVSRALLANPPEGLACVPLSNVHMQWVLYALTPPAGL